MLKKIKINNKEVAQYIEQLSDVQHYDFPKYSTQIINLVNGNAQGTRPEVVGQMSELIQEFEGNSLTEWMEWYSKKQPNAIQMATDKIWAKLQEMRSTFEAIDRDMVEAWVKDLVYTKTYCGLKFQSAIIAFLAEKVDKPYRSASKEEEARGIDGFIGGKPVQVKSVTYKIEDRLSETIEVPIVYYDKKKDGISIEYDTEAFK